MKTLWKTLSYNFWATITGFVAVTILTGIITGDWRASWQVGGISSVVIRATNIPLFYTHEKSWRKINGFYKKVWKKITKW